MVSTPVLLRYILKRTMDPQVRTSFIPKKPIDTAVRPRSGGGLGIFFFLSVILFLGSALLAGGAFLYEKQLASSIVKKSDQLATARAQFEPATIQNLIRLDDRLVYSKQVLSAHVAPSAIFSLLAASTLSTVSFTQFSYARTPDGSATLALSGITKAFSEVALQSDEFGKLRQLKDTIFSNFNVGEDGSVVFSVKANIDPEFLLYKTLLASGGVAPQTTTTSEALPETPAATPQTTTP